MQYCEILGTVLTNIGRRPSFCVTTYNERQQSDKQVQLGYSVRRCSPKSVFCVQHELDYAE